MIEVKSYRHATILARDLERTRCFYRAVLGLKEIERPSLNFAGTWFAVGEQELHIALALADFDKVPSFLQQMKIPFRMGSNPARRQIFFRDPDGNLIELQPAPTDA